MYRYQILIEYDGTPYIGWQIQRKGRSIQKTIQLIYKTGQKIYKKSFILIWKLENENHKSKMLISIPKRNIKTAVDRNYIKRIIKEVYRENKNDILKITSKSISFILIYNKTVKPEFNKLKVELLTLFQILKERINENN